MCKLAGRVALISGSGRGIGRAVALKLASEGACVVVNDIDETAADEVQREIKSLGGQAVACVGDVTDIAFAERFVNTALTTFGDLHIIVNNAGYTLDGVIQKQTDEQFQTMLDVHVTAPFRILRAAAEPLRTMYKKESQDGREIFRKVVNISSIAGTNGNAGQVNYSSAKAAIVGMTKTLSKEWGRYKICVNCVAFGFIETRLTKANTDPVTRIEIAGQSIQAGVTPSTIEALRTIVPLGRAGTPLEAAGSVYLMCIPESDYISGHVLQVAGGLNF
jgi:3-oxoacyl-[acyl-carrier protein] reductase